MQANLSANPNAPKAMPAIPAAPMRPAKAKPQTKPTLLLGAMAAINFVLMVASVQGQLATLTTALGLDPGFAPYLALPFALATITCLKLLMLERLPTAIEALASSACLALLISCADVSTKVWQVPQDYTMLRQFSVIGTAFALGFFLLCTMSAYGRSFRPMRFVELAFATATPFLFNLTLSLGGSGLMHDVGWRATLHFFTDDHTLVYAGRIATLFVVSEAITLGFGAVVFRLARSWRMHGLLFIASTLAAITPVIADLASMPGLPYAVRGVVAIGCAALAQAGLWSLVFLLTGVIIDGLRSKPPHVSAVYLHWSAGFVKGAIYGGLFLALILGVNLITSTPWLAWAIMAFPLVSGAILGALSFPLLETIVSSADATPPFFGRLRLAYKQPRSYIRGAVIGLGIGFAYVLNLGDDNGWLRFCYCAVLGSLAYAGVDMAWDCGLVIAGHRRRPQTPRLYTMGIILGGFVGGALGWYLDANQISVIAAKFSSYANLDYIGSGKGGMDYFIYPLFNKYGVMDLGQVQGGVRLLYNESLSGVINWSLAAPLFSINFVFLAALLQRKLGPIRGLFSAGGFDSLVEQGVRVLRWGLWMAPVIFSFLRMSTTPDWYNQDGLVHTLIAIFASTTSTAQEFNLWSLSIFTGLLAYDWLRMMIWFDHMGLRVATLVNLSFLAGDMADEHAARYIGHNAKTRVIPDGIRRFGTWAPLLIPFYIPRGADWDMAWKAAETLHKTQAPMPLAVETMLWVYGMAALTMLALAIVIAERLRKKPAPIATNTPLDMHPTMLPNLAIAALPSHVMEEPRHYRLSNGAMVLDIGKDGRGALSLEGSARQGNFIDISRRPTDALQLRGPFFFLREQGTDVPFSMTYEPTRHVGEDYAVKVNGNKSITFSHTYNGLKLALTGALNSASPVMTWTMTIEDMTGFERHLTATRFLELAMNEAGAYVRDPDYNGMHVETWYVNPLQAIIARNRLLRTREKDPVKKRISPEVSVHSLHLTFGRGEFAGYEDSRTRFVGQGTLRTPDGLDTATLRQGDDEGRLDTFDPAASLAVKFKVPPRGSVTLMAIDAHGDNPEAAVALLCKALKMPVLDPTILSYAMHKQRLLVPVHKTDSATPLVPTARGQSFNAAPFAFDDEAVNLILSPHTPRPWAHVMGNALGHGTMVNNDGEIYSLEGNARHNGLTALRFESIGTPLPGQLIYVSDLESGDIQTPGFAPFRDAKASHEVVYAPGVATFQKVTDTMAMRCEVFTPPDAPLDVRLLTLHNPDNKPRTYRITPYFDMALDENPQDSAGHLTAKQDKETNTLLFTQPKNNFKTGVAFAKVSFTPEHVATIRTQFIGKKPHDLQNPVMVATGQPDVSIKDDKRKIAAFSGTITLGAHQSAEFAIVLGQAETKEEALHYASYYSDVANAKMALEETKAWWRDQTGRVRITTNRPDFDRLVNDWFPYQMQASRLFARLGPNQRGGAIGYRDQLQDVLPLVFTAPDRARAQIILHAGQQFLKGDVLKWWHSAPNGETGIGQRTRASDPHVWLPYVTARYIAATGDASVLDVRVPYLEGADVPEGTDAILIAPRQSEEVGTVYEHCCRALDFALSRRGEHGLPHIGSGDWNDGIDIAGFHEKGESVWLGCFLHDTLQSFAPLVAPRQGEARAEYYRLAAASIAKGLESAWNGEFYMLNFSDDGTPMNFPNAMTTGWPLLSGAVGRERGRAALEGGLRFIERDDRVLLVTPPFSDDSVPYPGRIADYPPGVRENGGQYTHGASWIIDSFVRLALLDNAAGDYRGSRQAFARAFEIWQKISPLGKTEGKALEIYGLAPHQQPADIYDGAGHDGRGGWSWYTGSAARMVSAAYALLGIEMVNGEIILRDDAFMPKGGLQLMSVKIDGVTIRAPQMNKSAVVAAQ